MDSTITFRRLTMISFLHRYFLDTEENYFSLLSGERAERLFNVISRNRYPLMNDLMVEPTEETKKNLAGLKIIFKILPQGILLGTAIESTEVNGKLKTKPLVSFPSTLRLQFTLRKRNGFEAYTSSRIGTVLPAAYYFTNENPGSDKTFPSLSVPAKNAEQNRIYEMGEIAVLNGNLTQCIRTTTSANVNDWKNISPDNYVTEYDRILIGKKVTYTFEIPGIKKAKFTLSNKDGVIKEINAEDKNALAAVDLDWQKKDDNRLIPDGFYSLTVSGDNNYRWSSDVYLNDTVNHKNSWGFLDIAIHTADSKFSLIDQDGCLNDDPLKYPNLELRFLSRSTYWKYFFQKKSPPVNDQNWTDLPAPAGISKLIMSKEPMLLRHTYQKVKYSDDFLPNPSDFRLSKHDDKICSEILLTTIKL